MVRFFDGDSSRTFRFSYDGLGRLRSKWELVWDEGEQAEVETDVVYYIYDCKRVIQHRSAPLTPIATYTRGLDLSGSMEGAGGIGGLLARSEYSSGVATNHAYYHADGNGNITYMIDGSQTMVATYRYDPFGNTISSSGTLASTNLYRFSSKEIHPPSGLYYYGYRFYAPHLQRWLNRDPLGSLGIHFTHRIGGKRFAPVFAAAEFVVGPNLQVFPLNDPISFYDAFGLFGEQSSPIVATPLFSPPSTDPSPNPFSQPIPNGNSQSCPFVPPREPEWWEGFVPPRFIPPYRLGRPFPRGSTWNPGLPWEMAEEPGERPPPGVTVVIPID